MLFVSRKTKGIKFDFNKEITVKTTLKQKLIVDLSSSLFAMVILYIFLTELNEDIISILSGIGKNYSAMTVVSIILPILVIIKVMFTLGQYVVSASKENK